MKSKNGFHKNKQLKKQETETSISEAEFNKDGLKYKSKPKKFSGCDQFYFDLSAFALMIWDGVGFFGTDHFKLLRLQGEKVNFCTPFKSIKQVIIYILVTFITIYILYTEINKLGTQKAQTISFVRSDYYSYHYSNAIPLHAINWFYFDGLVKHIREH